MPETTRHWPLLQIIPVDQAEPWILSVLHIQKLLYHVRSIGFDKCIKARQEYSRIYPVWM